MKPGSFRLCFILAISLYALYSFDPFEAKAMAAKLDQRESLCDSWLRPLAEETSARVETGACAGEIYATMLVLEHEDIICVPSERTSEVMSEVISKFISRNRKMYTKTPLWKITFDGFIDAFHCAPGTRGE